MKTFMPIVGVFLVGFFTGMFFFIISISVYVGALERRSVEVKAAHYHPQTAELVWDDEKARYIVTGNKK